MNTSQRIAPACAFLAATLSLAAPPLLADDALTIADLAPSGSVVVVGVDDFAAMKAAFDRTGMRRIMDEPSVKQWIEDVTREASRNFTEMLESIDARMEDLSMPTGAAGFALWMLQPEGPDDPPFAVIAMGDFGEGADAMHDTLVAAFEEGEDKNQIIMRLDEFEGTRIYTLEQVEQEEQGDADNDGDEEADEWEEWEGWEDDLEDEGPSIDTVYYARVGSRLLAATTLDDLENAIERIGGGKLESVRESEQFHAARAQVGAHDAYAILLTEPLYRAAEHDAEKAAEEFGGAGPQVMPILDALGITEVRALSMGMKFDADDGMMITKYGALVPRMRALLSLFDVQPASFEPPPFVSADTATFSMMQFKLGDVMRVLSEFVQGLPADQAQSFAMILPMVQNFAGPTLDALGSEIYVAQSYARPFDAQSQKTLFAVKAKDPEALAMAMAGTAASVGLVSRDFQGSQIWSLPADSPMGAMMPVAPGVAIGIGFGHMFIGPEATVESALRQAGQEDAVSLAREERFRRAASAARAQGVAFSYTNLPKTIDYMKWFLRNYDEIMKAQMQQMMGDPDDPELRAMMEQTPPEKPQWLENLPDLDVIARHMGDSISELHRTDDGIRGRTVWLRPTE